MSSSGINKTQNKTMTRHYILDIEVHTKWGEKHWAQAKYLVHGHNDVLWTNSIDEAIAFLKASLMAVS